MEAGNELLINSCLFRSVQVILFCTGIKCIRNYQIKKKMRLPYSWNKASIIVFRSILWFSSVHQNLQLKIFKQCSRKNVSNRICNGTSLRKFLSRLQEWLIVWTISYRLVKMCLNLPLDSFIKEFPKPYLFDSL